MARTGWLGGGGVGLEVHHHRGQARPGHTVEQGVVADANAFCEALWAEIASEPADTEKRAHWEGKVADLVVPWNKKLEPGRTDRTLPLRISAVLDIVHGAVPPDTIVLTGAGHSQAQFLQVLREVLRAAAVLGVTNVFAFATEYYFARQRGEPVTLAVFVTGVALTGRIPTRFMS